jgi:hypothetical protein
MNGMKYLDGFRLPRELAPLDGWFRVVFMVVWWLLLALSLTGSISGAWNDLRPGHATSSPTQLVGIVVGDAPWPTVRLVIGNEAVRSGLHPGDRLVRIDGKPVGTDRQAIDAQLAGPVGGSVMIEARSRFGQLSSYRLTRNPLHRRQALEAIGLNPVLDVLLTSGVDFLRIALVITCAAWLMIRRSRDRLAPWASMMMLSIVLATSDTSSWYQSVPGFWSEVHLHANVPAFVLLIGVLALFPDGCFRPRWTWAVVIGAAIVVPAMNYSNIGLSPEIENVIFLLLMALAIALIVARHRSMPAGTGRQQIRWALLGFFWSLVCVVALVILEIFSDKASTFSAGTWTSILQYLVIALLNALLMIAITISLLHYRLYDADETITRSITFGIVSVALLLIFAGAEKAIEILGEEYFGARLGAIASGTGAAVAAVMIGPLHHRVTLWAERRFRSQLGHLRLGLPLLVANMRETATPLTLANTALARIEKGVHADHGAVIIENDVLTAQGIDDKTVRAWLAKDSAQPSNFRRLYCDRTDPAFPMRVPLYIDDVGLLGWLLLGPRPDGSFFNKEERETLLAIADPMARALAIAFQREKADGEWHREVGALRGMIDRLNDRLNRHFGPDTDELACDRSATCQQKNES